jgi:nucleoside 2-deoxyribosyltransferase
MTVYVAGSWNARDYIRNVTTALRANGIECTNGWMDREALTAKEKQDCAWADLSEVNQADALLLVTRTESTAGGMHFESGYAFATGKKVFIVGQPHGVFHYLSGIQHFADLSDFIARFGVKADCGCGSR